jgi:transposase
MIDYETYCKVLKLKSEGLRVSQISQTLGLDERTVERWIEANGYRQRKSVGRPSKLDPYKPQIARWLEMYPYSSVQILQRIRDEGYQGGISILKDYVSTIRPRKVTAFLTLSFAPGECAQVDWGQYATVRVGSTQRRLSFFVMVLCYSRMMYVEFTVSETMEHFLECHKNAFEFFGATPGAIMVDNLKCAVIKRLTGQAPIFNPRYQDFANHYGFKIRACGVGKGNEKGRVENAVGYVKKNFLAGLDINDFSAVNPAAKTWLREIANVRIHGTTHKQPVELFATEKPSLRALAAMPYDAATIRMVRANNRFRVALDGNRYSVPSEYAGSQLTLKAAANRLCFYHNNNLIATHARSYDRNQDFENPDHPRALLQQRLKAREQRLLMRFLTLSSKAEAYYEELSKRRMNPRHHIRQIVALSEIYGPEKLARAIEDAFTYQAFSCEYIANILEQRGRIVEQPGVLHVTRRLDLLDLEIPEPNLSIYDTDQDPIKEGDTGHECEQK